MRGLRLVPEETKVDFISKRFIAFAFSCVLLLSSVFFAATSGLNFGIDFTGGTLIEIKTEGPADLSAMRGDLEQLDLGGISLQEFGEPDDVLIRLPKQDGGADAQQAAIDSVRGVLGEEVDYRRVEYVGPQVGEELKEAGLIAILCSLGGILLYIWFRFEWQFGIAAIMALAHDAIATVGLFSFTQMEFNLSTVAAVLMIAGYSINDTVVVFDRIRENMRRFKKMSLSELCNLSLNQMLSRTLMTSVTTLLALVALYAFGGEVIRGFVVALIWGIIIGTYSSVFVASPLLLYMNLRENVEPAKSGEPGTAEA